MRREEEGWGVNVHCWFRASPLAGFQTQVWPPVVLSQRMKANRFVVLGRCDNVKERDGSLRGVVTLEISPDISADGTCVCPSLSPNHQSG